MKASEIYEGGVYALGKIQSGTTIPTGRKVRVKERNISRYGGSGRHHRAVMFLCEDCIDDRRLHIDEALDDAVVNGHFDY